MASPAQFVANQANAQSSTGPRTPQGNAHVSQNAIKHGLTSRHLVIAPDQQEFDALQAALLSDLDPQGAVETVVFHDLLHAASDAYAVALCGDMPYGTAGSRRTRS